MCLVQAIDAKRAAAEEVERLLQHPEDLKRLSGLLEDYTQKHQVNNEAAYRVQGNPAHKDSRCEYAVIPVQPEAMLLADTWLEQTACKSADECWTL